MPSHPYKTLADELLEYADLALSYFEQRGFSVRAECSVLGFPYTPALLCKRGATTKIVEVDSKVQLQRLEDWVGYCRSSGRDTRLALCVPSSADLSASDLNKLQERGVGLYLVSPDAVVERLVPRDLGLNIALPELAREHVRVRELLGSSYEQFGRAQWREGFEDACQALESQARRYLKKWTRSGRIRILRPSGPIALTNKQINRLTMGQLAREFSNIAAQNHADSVIADALSRINTDRVGVVHHKGRAVTERRLRTNVGQHMWVIVAAMREMV
jgi:hypothetical protein